MIKPSRPAEPDLMSTWIDLPKLPPADAPDLFARVELLLTLIRALHKVGQPTHRLESNVVAVGKHLGLTVQIMALPTGAIFSIQTAGGHQTQMLRLSGARLDLWRWTQLASISEDIKHGGIDPATARQ